MADDITYDSIGASVPINTKQVTDEHPTRGHMPVVKLAYSADGETTLVPADVNGLKVNVGTTVLPTDAATQTTLAAILAKLIASPSTEATAAAILAKLSADPATQTTLAAVLAKLSADPATQTTLVALSAKIPALGQALAAASLPVVLPATQITTLTPPAAITGFALETGGNLATIAVKDFATQTTLAAVLAKQPTSPALDGTDITTPTAMPAGGVGIRGWLSAIWTKLNGTLAVTGTFWQATQPVSGTVTANAGTGTLATSTADGSNVAIGALADAAVTAGATGSISAKLRSISRDIVANIVLAAGTNAIGKLAANAGVNIGVVGGTTIEVTDEFTRVADTNVYAVGDAIGATVSNTGTTALRGITVGAAVGATGYLTKIRLWTDQAACVAQIRVHFFTVAAPTTALPGDNVANIAYYANRAQSIGYVDLPALGSETGANTGARATDMTTRLPFQCDAADTKLYYRLQTQTIFTPASAQAFYLALTAERNGG